MWDVILSWMFSIIQFFYDICKDWGLSIIIVTVIFRILVSPLMHKQAKSTYEMQKIQPEIQRIQQKYAGDQMRISQETQKLYADAKVNPITGCLPMLLQIPLFIILFQVLRDMGHWVSTDTVFSFYNIVPNLIMTPAVAFENSFRTFVPYLILMIIFAVATFIPMILQQFQNKESSTRNQTLLMGVFMTIFMLWVSWGSPAGVLIFWGVSSLIGIAQNQFTLYRCRREDKEQAAQEVIEVKPIEVDVIRKEKKKRPSKKH